MTRLPSFVVLPLALAMAVTAEYASAQEPLSQYWAELERATSVAQLPVPRGEADSVIAQGLYLLRRFELQRDRTDAFVARQQLGRRVERSPDDAWAHFALGALLARGPDVRVVLGEDRSAYVAWQHSLAVRHAPRALRRALELKPDLHEAALALGEFALDQGDRALMGEAVRELARAGRERMPDALELRAELLLMLRDPERSAALADSAALAGGDPSVAAHLKAAALVQVPGREALGARAYLDGVDRLTERGAARYYDAVSALATPRELAEWKTADPEGRRAWLRRFWEVQSALAGVALPERLAEHFRRLAQVRREGRVSPMGGVVGAFDPREFGVPSMSALTLLRHGDPERVQRVLWCGPDVLDVPLPLQPSVRECRQSPLGRNRLIHRLATFQAQDRATPGSSYYPAFETHLTLAWDVLQFRGERSATDVVAAVGLPTESAGALRTGEALIARAELLLVDTVMGTVQRQEELRRFAAGPLPPGGWMLLSTALASRSFRPHAFRIAVTDSARRAGRIVGGDITVRDFHTGELTLSDVVLAPLDGTPSFARGDHRVSLAPGREFRRSESIALYYEVYGLTQGDAYATEISVEPVPGGLLERVRSRFAGARESLRLRFAEQAGDVHGTYGVQQLRTLGLEGLVPGTYRLTVRVTDGSGRSAGQERELYVVEDGR